MSETTPQYQGDSIDSVGYLIGASRAGGLSEDEMQETVGGIHRYLQKGLFDEIVKPASIGIALSHPQESSTKVVETARKIVESRRWYTNEIGENNNASTISKGGDLFLSIDDPECSSVCLDKYECDAPRLIDELANKVNSGRVQGEEVGQLVRSCCESGHVDTATVFETVLLPLVGGIAAQGVDARNERVVEESAQIAQLEEELILTKF